MDRCWVTREHRSFYGRYIGFSHQRFFLPPSASEHCRNLITKYDTCLIEEPEPYRLLHNIAGSDAAFGIWCPWANRDCIEYPPLRSGTFRGEVLASDEESEEELGPAAVAKVSEEERDWAVDMMASGNFRDALPVLVRAAHSEPNHYGNWYMAGQCYRFTNDFAKAIEFLKQAARLNPGEREIFLALGIAFQLYGDLNNAIGALVKALALDPNYEAGYNSLALTQMKKGEYELALHNYDEALKAMTRRLVSDFRNAPGRGITKFHDAPYSLWGEYAVFGMTFIAASDPSITSVAWPTGEFAQHEERDEGYEGLFWHDQSDGETKKTRLFLPNYFNTFESRLHDDSNYAVFLRAKGTALEALGRQNEAEQHYAEADYFHSR